MHSSSMSNASATAAISSIERRSACLKWLTAIDARCSSIVSIAPFSVMRMSLTA